MNGAYTSKPQDHNVRSSPRNNFSPGPVRDRTIASGTVPARVLCGNGIQNSAAVEPIAIIGIAGCRLPGDCTSPSRLWDLLANKRSGHSKIPRRAFNIDAFYHPNHDRPGSIEADGGYFLNEDIRAFDPSFFGITPLEATTLDPQQRKLLEVTYEAFENGGVTLERVSGSKTGCFVANFTCDFSTMQYKDAEFALGQPYLLTGMGLTILSNRLSYAFNLCGPSLTLDTACSSSIYALHLACQSIQDGSCDAAVVAGTNLIMTVDQHMASAKLGVLSPTSQCHTFDASADGYARGEGVSALYIKRLSDAVKDGDPIRAVIRGTAFNSNGRSPGGITNPSPKGQEAVIREAYRRAGLSNRLWQTGYFECHGTGTKVGDPLEVAGIGNVFAEGRDAKQSPLLIGSVKTSVGHGEAASGITSVIKCVLALEKGQIPATIGLKNPNPDIDFDGARVKVVTELTPWPMNTGQVRRASINSFGYGGANAHAIIDATPAFYTKDTVGSPLLGRPLDSSGLKSKFLLPFSAHDLPTLKANIAALREVVGKYDIKDLAYTLGVRRSKFYHRGYAIVDMNHDELSLQEQLEEEEITLGRKPSTGSRLGFIFTGQGAQWARMGVELLTDYPSFLQTIRYLDDVLSSLADDERPTWTLEKVLLEPPATSKMNEVAFSQPICTAVQIALVELLSSWGIRPVAVVGHSSGEIAAAYTAGKISMENAIKVAYYRGYSCTNVTIPMEGAMLAVGLGPAEVAPYIESNARVKVACINSPKSVTLSGDRADVEQVKMLLDEKGIFARLLITGGRAYHSHHMKLVGGDYQQRLEENVHLESPGMYRPSVASMVSSVTMKVIADDLIPCSYWRGNLESPVMFSPALERLIKEFSLEQIVEIGPHSALSGPVRDVREALGLNSLKLAYLPSLVRNQDATISLLTLAGTLFIRDYPVDMGRVNSIEVVNTETEEISIITGRTLVDLPTYRWQYPEVIHWNENRASEEWRNRTHPRHDLLGSRVTGVMESEPVWRNILRVKHLPWLAEHAVDGTVIFPGVGYMALAIEAATQLVELRPPPVQIQGYRLQNVVVKTALRFSANDAGVEMVFSMRPLSMSNSRTAHLAFEFKVTSLVGGKWSEHCKGSIKVLTTRRREPTRKWTAALAEKGLHPSSAATRWYKGFSNLGLQYGPAFAGLSNIKVNGRFNLATADAPLHPTKDRVPGGESRYAVHPCMLDTILQVGLIATHAKTGVMSMNRCFLPVAFEDVYIYPPSDPSATHAAIVGIGEFYGLRTVVGHLQARVGQELIVDVKELSCISFDSRTALAQTSHEKLQYSAPFLRLQWKPDVDALTQVAAVKLFPPVKKPNLLRVWEDWWTVALIMLIQVTEEVPEAAVIPEPHLKHWYKWMLKRIAESKAGKYGAIWDRVQQFTTPDEREAEITRLTKYLHPEVPEIIFCHNVYLRIPDILRGAASGVEVLMVDNLHLNADSYANGIRHRTAYSQLEKLADLLGHKNPEMKVLEIGAGTGSATQVMLDVLNGKSAAFRRYSSYDFTDVGKGFLGTAQKRFEAYAGLEYGVLDIEKEPAGQGYGEGEYDLVISANCLHATSKMHNTLSNVRKLLKPGGHLLLFEIVSESFCATIMYGCLLGYWMGIEDGRVDHPFLLKSQWDRLFAETGFSGLNIALDDFEGHIEPTSVMLTRAVESLPAPERSLTSGENRLAIIHRNSPTQYSPLVAHHALSTGHEPILLSLQAYSDLQDRPDMAIVLVDLENDASSPLIPTMTAPELEALKTLTTTSHQILWITAGGLIEGKNPDHALIHGLARTIKSEQTGLKFGILDVDTNDNSLSMKAASEVIVDTWTRLRNSSDLYEREFCVKDGVLHISRVTEEVTLNAQYAKNRMGNGITPVLTPYDHTKAMQVDIEQPGLFDSFFFKPDSTFETPPESDEVDIEVKAAGLTFKDITVTMGNFDNPGIGWEYAGKVKRIGSNVKGLKVGDRVATAIPRHLNSFIRVKEMFCVKIEESESYEEIVSMLIAYGAAIYALVDQAKVKPGETVLVHGGSSAFGRACIQVAMNCGATVYTTVSSSMKSEFVQKQFGIPASHIFNSRDNSFIDGILDVTDDQGVNVVISTLSGELFHETTACLSPHGRMIDAGRSDVYDHAKLDMACFKLNLMYFSMDLGALWRTIPDLHKRLLNDILSMYREGKIHPITPIQCFHITEVAKAFRMFGQRTVGGKVVIKYGPPPEENKLMQLPAPQVIFDTNAAYLLVGCLGGLGRSLSRWMASRGARHFLFLSRSGTDNPDAADLVTELESIGCEVQVTRGDVCNYDDVEKAILSSECPIKGVVQAAMVLKDAIFSNMTLEAFNTAMMPKVLGTKNLHAALMKHNAPLQFFVMTSSISSYVGHMSQGNYSAGNAFLDAMARHRVALGLPATTLALGVIEEVGYIEQQGPYTAAALKRLGLHTSTEDEFLQLMEGAMKPELMAPSPGTCHDPHARAYLITGLDPSQMLDLQIDSTRYGVGAALAADIRSSTIMHAVRNINARKNGTNAAQNSSSSNGDLAPHSLRDLVMTPGTEGIEALTMVLRQRIAVLLMLDLEQVEEGKTVMEYGLDSMVGAELRNWLFLTFRVQIPFLELLDPAMSIRGLAERVRRKMEDLN
ncbi:hypothetical protein BDZ91DRAFT_662290 [Kalaharituber pfeilii]|nr:hypothetical protein BDZ91DRAFT_662290 [Kalaharituber pfeilii]